MRLFAVFILLCSALTAAAQSGRSAVQNSRSTASSNATVKQLFDEANAYTKKKFAEFEAKKIKYSEALEQQANREKKQLAAKYAAQAQSRTDLKGEDFYYLGLLHWIAENLDGTAEGLRKYSADPAASTDKAQTSRSIIAVVEAKRASPDQAAVVWNEYQKHEPKKLTEVSRMANEIAKSFIAAKDLQKATPFALEAYKASKSLSADPAL